MWSCVHLVLIVILCVGWYVWTIPTHNVTKIYYFSSLNPRIHICLTSPLWPPKHVSCHSSTANQNTDEHLVQPISARHTWQDNTLFRAIAPSLWKIETLWKIYPITSHVTTQESIFCIVWLSTHFHFSAKFVMVFYRSTGGFLFKLNKEPPAHLGRYAMSVDCLCMTDLCISAIII